MDSSTILRIVAHEVRVHGSTVGSALPHAMHIQRKMHNVQQVQFCESLFAAKV